MEVQRELRGTVLGAHLAQPDRYERLPDNLESRPAGRRPPAWWLLDVLGSDPLVEDDEIPWLEADPPTRRWSWPSAKSIRLAFVAALQHLPARQRAVLILRDVLRWSAAEVAEALETTQHRRRSTPLCSGRMRSWLTKR